MLAIIAALVASQPEPRAIPLAVNEAQEMTTAELSALLLDGVDHHEIVSHEVMTDHRNRLSHVFLAERGREFEGVCARDLHDIHFDGDKLFNRRTVEFVQPPGDCTRIEQWTNLGWGLDSSAGASILAQLSAIQSRIRNEKGSLALISCVDETMTGACQEDVQKQFSNMPLRELAAIDGPNPVSGQLLNMWFRSKSERGGVWSLRYLPQRNANDVVIMIHRYPPPATPAPPTPPVVVQ